MPADLAPGSFTQTQQSPDSADPVVVFEDVSITFDIKPVLQNISFTVHRGETRIILGPAGGGKSVLMKLANGLIRPDSGTIRVFGEDVTHMRETDLFKLRARIGMVFQESALFDSLSVEDNVAYRLHEEQVPEEEAHKRVIEVSNSLNLRTPSRSFRLSSPAECDDASPSPAPSSPSPTSSFTTPPPAASTLSPQPRSSILSSSSATSPTQHRCS